jgi:hypothetical protein
VKAEYDIHRVRIWLTEAALPEKNQKTRRLAWKSRAREYVARKYLFHVGRWRRNKRFEHLTSRRCRPMQGTDPSTTVLGSNREILRGSQQGVAPLTYLGPAKFSTKLY